MNNARRMRETGPEHIPECTTVHLGVLLDFRYLVHPLRAGFAVQGDRLLVRNR